jgi:four helix bundle protein
MIPPFFYLHLSLYQVDYNRGDDGTEFVRIGRTGRVGERIGIVYRRDGGMYIDGEVHFRELNVYRIAKEVADDVFRMSALFPKEEKYSLTDQIRRSSRSVCANIAEAWRRRKYRAAFIAKLNDCESECSETQVWLDFARDCGYIDEALFKKLDEKCERIAGMLVRMATTPDHWTIRVAEKQPEYSSCTLEQIG